MTDPRFKKACALLLKATQQWKGGEPPSMEDVAWLAAEEILKLEDYIKVLEAQISPSLGKSDGT